MILQGKHLLECNPVYYPCFDPAYPRSDWELDFRILPLLFDFVVVPPSHILQSSLALEAMQKCEALFRSSICIGSIHLRQNSLQEFYFAKASELDYSIPTQVEDAFLRHAENYRMIFHRDSVSQSAAFRHSLAEFVKREVPTGEGDTFLAQLPKRGNYPLHRETLDRLANDIHSAILRTVVQRSISTGYFAAGAVGNYSFLYDPRSICPELGSTRVPREAFRFATALAFMAKIPLAELRTIPIPKIVALHESRANRLFRHTLLSTIQSASGSYEQLIREKEKRQKKAFRRRSLGYALAGACAGAIGLADIKAGIAALLATSVMLPSVRKAAELFDRLSDPVLCFKEELSRTLLV